MVGLREADRQQEREVGAEDPHPGLETRVLGDRQRGHEGEGEDRRARTGRAEGRGEVPGVGGIGREAEHGAHLAALVLERAARQHGGRPDEQDERERLRPERAGVVGDHPGRARAEERVDGDRLGRAGVRGEEERVEEHPRRHRQEEQGAADQSGAGIASGGQRGAVQDGGGEEQPRPEQGSRRARPALVEGRDPRAGDDEGQHQEVQQLRAGHPGSPEGRASAELQEEGAHGSRRRGRWRRMTKPGPCRSVSPESNPFVQSGKKASASGARSTCVSRSSEHHGSASA